MFYKKSDILDLSLNQTSQEKMSEALVAFNGFADIFGKEWVDSFFGNGAVKSPFFTSRIVDLWYRWNNIKDLNKANEIAQRWKKGVDSSGVIPEVIILSELKKIGGEIELFPSTDKGRFADAKFFMGSYKPVFLEISKRGIMEIMRGVNSTTNLLAQGVANVSSGQHCKLGICRSINKQELDSILKWLERIRPSINPQTFSNFGIFHTTSIETGGGEISDESVKFVPRPRIFATNLKLENGQVVNKGTVTMYALDEGAIEYIKGEAAQLPHDGGVLVLDITNVVDGVKVWTPIINTWFNKKEYSRVSAVILVDVRTDLNGLKKNGLILVNPYARKKLDSYYIDIFKNIFNN